MKDTAERQALPPAFMRGEGRKAAGGVPRSGGESLLSHGFAVPAPPEGKPRALRTVLAPRIYEGGGPRSGRGSPPPQRESPLSHGFAVPAPPEGKPRVLRTVLAPRIYEGGEPRSGRGSSPPQREPSQSRLRRASSPGGRAKGTVVVPQPHSMGSFPRQRALLLGMTRKKPVEKIKNFFSVQWKRPKS